jgi:hypothetical protein
MEGSGAGSKAWVPALMNSLLDGGGTIEVIMATLAWKLLTMERVRKQSKRMRFWGLCTIVTNLGRSSLSLQTRMFGVPQSRELSFWVSS